ncbi:MAG: hypothetical protein ABI761_04850 [Saprospiraceae bacterium]
MSCKEAVDKTPILQSRIDSLELKISESYKPGLGEFMSGIQIHHAKLWFAGLHENWKLADFEINEIIEALDDIKQFCKDRPEVASLNLIDQSIDSMSNAIQHKDLKQFKNNFTLLTNTCNRCHQVTDHEFNVIKIPDIPPFSNQDFKTKQ